MFYRFFILCILSIEIFVPVLSYAETADELQSNLNSLSSKIQALDKEIKEYNIKISQTQGEAKTLKQALARLELNRAELVKEIDHTKLRIKQTETNISITKKQIGITENTLTKNKNALAEILRSLVIQDQSISPFITSLSKGSHVSDILDMVKRSNDVSNAINQKVSDLIDTKEVLSSEKITYESHKKTLENLNSNLINQKTLVEQTTKEKNNLLIQTNNKESEYQKLVIDRKNKKNKLEAEMLDVESRLKVITDASKLPKTGKGVLQYPVDKVIVTQYFGNTPFSSQNPQVYNGSGHNGIDFGLKIGSPIYAASSGVVLGTGDTDASCSGVSYGKWVLIRHNNGLTSLYAHLSVIQVKAGDAVTTRQQIALSGNTGYSTGPHLHFTVYASDSVHISLPNEYKSKVCGTYMIMPLAPRSGYLNPLSYL